MLMPVFGGKLDGQWADAPETPSEYVELAGERYEINCCSEAKTTPTSNPDEPIITQGPLLWWLGTDDANVAILFEQVQSKWTPLKST